MPASALEPVSILHAQHPAPGALASLPDFAAHLLSVPLSLAAEIQHRLLPGAFTCEAGQFTLAAWLQPAGEIGGDTFDFSLDRDTLHLSMTDAMGHTMEAALLATVLVGGLRNARRRGVDLAEQARLANDALADQAGDEQFVTGLVVRIDLDSGVGEPFLHNREPGPASAHPGSGGLERPVDCKFHPDGRSLYVLDFGVTVVAPTHVVAYARTGVLWRVTRH